MHDEMRARSTLKKALPVLVAALLASFALLVFSNAVFRRARCRHCVLDADGAIRSQAAARKASVAALAVFPLNAASNGPVGAKTREVDLVEPDPALYRDYAERRQLATREEEEIDTISQRLWSMSSFSKEQMSLEQYHYVASVIRALAPANVLIWGVGVDSPDWARLNAGGCTVFLEDSTKWIRDVQALARSGAAAKSGPLELDIRQVAYYTSLRVRTSPLSRWVQVNLPADVQREDWDLILIDGPCGLVNLGCPGRMAPIATSASLLLARRQKSTTAGKAIAHVLVHDAEREAEREWSNHFFGSTFITIGGTSHSQDVGAVFRQLRHYAFLLSPPKS